jgi:WD40 repeat protein
MREIPSTSLTGHARRIHGVAFSPDGRHCATAGGDGRIFMWDAARWQQVATADGRRPFSRALCFAPDGRRIAASAPDRVVVYSAPDLAPMREWPLPGEGYGASVLQFGNEGADLVAAVSEDEDYAFGPTRVIRWMVDDETATPTSFSFEGMVRDIREAADSELVAHVYFANDDNVRVLRLLEMERGTVLNELDLSRCRGGGVPVVSEDGRWIGLGSGCFASDVEVLDARTGNSVAVVGSPTPSIPCLAFAGSRLAVGYARSQDPSSGVAVVALPAGERVWSGACDGAGVEQVLASRPHDLLAALSSDGAARFWRMSDGSPAGWSKPHQRPGMFSTDGQWFLTCGTSLRVTDVTAFGRRPVLETDDLQ